MYRIVHRVTRHTKKAGKHLWDHFVPHAGNDHHPHVLKHRVLVGYSVALVLLKALVIVLPIALPSSSLYSSSITRQNIVSLTNQTRENLNLAALNENEKLDSAAQAKAQDMVDNQYFAHTSPEGVTPWSWFSKVGYKYIMAGENLAVHFTSAEGVTEGWMASPSHRANIVNSKYTEIGVGVAVGEFEGYQSTFVVQTFGLPSGATLPAATVATATAPTPSAVKETSGQVAAAEQQAVKPVVETPAPVVEQSAAAVPEKITEVTPELILDESSVVVTQQPDSYQVRLTATGAPSVRVTLASETVTLTKDADTPNVWQGSVAYDATTFSKGGERLMIYAVSPAGHEESYAAAWVAPKASTQQVYTFNEGETRYTKVAGITIPNLQDDVRRVYFYFIVFLGAALLINILVKIRVQKLSVLGHATFVLALAVLLMTI